MKVKVISCLAAGVMLAAAAVTAQAQTRVALSVGSPGFYGAIDIGDAPPPTLVYQQPIAVQPVVVGDPLYLYVPPDQYANWGVYCGYYSACDRPVYFVNNAWYQRTYVPYYRSHRHIYERRRGEFDRHIYRPGPRSEMRNAQRFDNRRGEYRGAPAMRDEHRGMSGMSGERRVAPVMRDEHRGMSGMSGRGMSGMSGMGGMQPRPSADRPPLQIRDDSRAAPPAARPADAPHRAPSGREDHDRRR